MVYLVLNELRFHGCCVGNGVTKFFKSNKIDFKLIGKPHNTGLHFGSPW